MAATAPPSHARDPSMTALDHDNYGFSFPAPHQPQHRPPDDFQFPPHYSASSEPFAFPPRRGSVPSIGTGSLKVPVASARPRSSQADALKQLSANSQSAESSGLPSPESPDCIPSSRGSPRIRPSGRVVGDGLTPTVLNASIRLGPVPDRAAGSPQHQHQHQPQHLHIQHNREVNELLQMPMLEPPRDEMSPKPIEKRAPPPPGVNMRRGHAHRRSGAISSSDVWSLMNQSPPPPMPVPSAAAKQPHIDPSRPVASPVLGPSAPDSPEITLELISHPVLDDGGSEGKHARVCFTEAVEIIPRSISTSTEGSKGHGASDSISGPAAGTVLPSPVADPAVRVPSPARRTQNRTRSNSQTLTMPTAALRAQSDRPSTAGAVLSSVQTPKIPDADVPEIPCLERPASASPSMNPEASPVKMPPSKKAAHKKTQSELSPTPLLIASEEGSPNMLPESGASPTRGKKQKKKGKKQIKTWAGTILGGKLKHSKKCANPKPKRAPTPPPLSRSAEDLTPVESEWVATSWNESYVMMPIDTNPGMEIQKVTVSGGVGSPVIDLDAALGPFKTPIETNTGFAAARRRMHSAASRGNGAYFHRRSESMPEMQLFALEEDEDRTMEDVFEEEEDEDEGEEDEEETTSEEESSEDDDYDEEEGRTGSCDGLGIGVQVDDSEQQPMAEWSPKNEAVHVSRTTASSTHKRLSTSTITAVTVSTTATVTTTTSTTTTTAAIPDDDSDTTAAAPPPRRKCAPADIIMPHTPSQTPSSSPVSGAGAGADSLVPYSSIGPALDSPSTFVTASSTPNTPMRAEFASDDGSGRFDPYRDYLGEPGPEMRMSADDIPSLTSSSSTMTMNAAYLGMPSTPRAGDALPFPSAAAAAAGKDKKDKGKRWSRVWGFWRSK